MSPAGRPRRARTGARLPLAARLLRGRRWVNHERNQAIDPVAICEASSAEDLVTIVDRAREQGLTVRMVGSGHAWSDAALTTGYLVRPDGFRGVQIGHDIPAAAAGSLKLATVRSGTTVRELNAELARHGLALAQMGGYDGQTIAGVVATSTHGSGVGFPPFPDYVRSVDLVDGAGRCLRVEPAARAITDARRFEAERSGWELLCDDDTFHSVICGIGCLGLIVSLVLEVRDAFELTEVRELRTWREVRDDLLAGAPSGVEHYEVYVNPYRRTGQPRGANKCIVTTRAVSNGPPGPRHRPRGPELLGNLPCLPATAMRLAARFAPGLVPVLLDFSLSALAARYTNVSYEVFNIGSVNKLRVYSGEMALPTDGGAHVQAVENMLAVSERLREEAGIFHTSPVALRFVAPSRAYMSMMHERATMTMELIQIVDIDGATELIAAHEDRLEPFGVRPHWGQLNTVNSALIAARYPLYGRWAQVRAALDPDEVFAGPFSKRTGITVRGTGS